MSAGRPPGPRGLPFLGSVGPFARSPLTFLDRMAREHGDVVSYRLGPLPIVQLNHPDGIEEVLVQKHKSVIKDAGTKDLVLVLGQGLLTGEGEHWRRNRKLLAPLLQRSKIGRYAETMVQLAERLAAKTDPDGERDVHHDFMTLTFDVVMQALFATEGGADVERVSGDLETLMLEFPATVQSWLRVLPKWFPLAGRRRVARAVKGLHEMTESLIDGRKAAPGQGEDLVSRLLDARDETGETMSKEHIRDEALTMMLAGHETTALALTFAAWLLARHPEIQGRLHDEVSGALRGAAPQTDEVDRLPYTQAVFRETMRLYPPAWLIGRETTEDVALRSGFTLPTGTQIFLPQWVVHRDPRWWPEPETFRPERWLDAAPERPRFAYFPFGGGPRVCIGNHFAEVEGILILAVMAQRLEFTPIDNEPELELSPTITLRPKRPVPLRVRKRA